MKKYKIKWSEIYEKTDNIVRCLEKKDAKIYGIGFNGQIIAGLTGLACDYPEDADIIVDDIFDNADIYNAWLKLYPEKEFVFLYNKQQEDFDTEFEFPWDQIKE